MTGKPALPTVALLKLASQQAVETDKHAGILTSFELGKFRSNPRSVARQLRYIYTINSRSIPLPPTPYDDPLKDLEDPPAESRSFRFSLDPQISFTFRMVNINPIFHAYGSVSLNDTLPLLVVGKPGAARCRRCGWMKSVGFGV